MHKKYAAEGLDALSVNTDDLEEEKDAREKINRFLSEKGAAFTNVILDDKANARADKLEIEGLPSVLVFGRDGKLVKHYKAAEVDYGRIEKLVAEELKKQ